MEYLKDARYVLDECSECRLIYQKEIPDDFLSHKLYEEWIDPIKSRPCFDAKRYNPRGFLSMAEELTRVIEHLGKPPDSLTLVDFGMGWGHWCLIAKGFNCNVYGHEVSEPRIRNAETLGIKTIPWDRLAHYKFDFIHTEQVFEHLADPLETLAYLKQTLKRGGLIKISVPNGCDIRRRLQVGDWMAPKGSKNSLNAVAPLEHLNCFHHRSLRQMGQRLGLVPVSLKYNIDRLPAGASAKARLKHVIKPFYYGLRYWRFRFKGTGLFFEKRSD